jgi:tetratricopeptide (TPR) repeat protein
MEGLSAFREILGSGESQVQRDTNIALPLARAYLDAKDRRGALRVARAAGRRRLRALILVAHSLGFEEAESAEPDLLQEILSVIAEEPDLTSRDAYHGRLFAALQYWGPVEAALSVLRMIHKPLWRCDVLVNLEEYVHAPCVIEKLKPEYVEEAFSVLDQIDDPEDRTAMKDDFARPLAAIGRIDQALRLVDEVAGDDQEYHRFRRQLRLAHGLIQNGAPAAGLAYARQAVETAAGQIRGGFCNGLYADAAVIFARCGEFARAIDTVALTERRKYVVSKIGEICALLLDSGREPQAVALARAIPQVHEAAQVWIAIAERQAQLGRLEQAISLLTSECHLSDLGPPASESIVALTRLGGAYLKLGRPDLALRTVARQPPDGVDPNFWRLQARESLEIALAALHSGQTSVAGALLDYSLSCARQLHGMDYDRALVQAGLLTANLRLGRVDQARENWKDLENGAEPHSLSDACIRIGRECNQTDGDIPDDLVASVCAALGRTQRRY